MAIKIENSPYPHTWHSMENALIACAWEFENWEGLGRIGRDWEGLGRFGKFWEFTAGRRFTSVSITQRTARQQLGGNESPFSQNFSNLLKISHAASNRIARECGAVQYPRATAEKSGGCCKMGKYQMRIHNNI